MPAAPSAPPPAPAKPAAASPTPAITPPKPGEHTPPPAGERDPADWMGDVGADLDQLSADDDARAEGRTRAKPAAKPAAEPDPKPDPAKPAAAKPDEPKPGEAAPAPEPKGIAAVREAYQGIKKKVADHYEPTIQRLEARVKELEGQNPPEVKALTERLTAAEKRRDTLEQEIASVNYEQSSEYQEKYVKPYQQAWSKALTEVTQLNRELPDGTNRKATEDDILALANAPLDQLDDLAEKWFPRSAARVIRHVERIKELAEAQSNALSEARSKAVERLRTRETDLRTRNEQTRQLWSEANKAIETKWPQMFAAVEGDAEGNALLTKGEISADRLFSPATQEQVDRLTAEGKTAEAEAAKARLAPKTPEEAVRLHAFLRQKIRNHDRLALWHKRDLARIKELEGIVAEYEKSDPSGGLDGRGAATHAGNGGDDWNSEIDELDKKGR